MFVWALSLHHLRKDLRVNCSLVLALMVSVSLTEMGSNG